MEPQVYLLKRTTRFSVADGSLMKRGKLASETAEHVLYMIVDAANAAQQYRTLSNEF